MDIEDVNYNIEKLEEMYQLSLELISLNKKEFKLDTNFEEMRDEIDIRLSDFKEKREKLKG